MIKVSVSLFTTYSSHEPLAGACSVKQIDGEVDGENTVQRASVKQHHSSPIL